MNFKEGWSTMEIYVAIETGAEPFKNKNSLVAGIGEWA
jgi:hypothetical protein